MSKFDIADFEANRAKYELFRTARIATNKVRDFVKGEHVAVAFVTVAQEDCIQGRIVPVYEVTAANGCVHHLYANAFADFVL